MCHAQPCSSDDNHREKVRVKTDTNGRVFAHTLLVKTDTNGRVFTHTLLVKTDTNGRVFAHTLPVRYMWSVTRRNVRAVCWLHTEQLALLLSAAIRQHRAAELRCNVGSKITHTYRLMAVRKTDCWFYHVCPSVSHSCRTAGRTFVKSDKGFIITSVELIQVWLKSVRNQTNLPGY